MIRKNLINCKLFFQKCLTPDGYDDFIRRFNPALERCPSCGALGCCRFHARYERSLVEIEDGSQVCHRIRIMRVRCKSCGHTHAILPDRIVPYRQYSLPFILRVLQLYFTHAMTVERIYEFFEVTHTVLYRWISTFGKHTRLWLGMADAAKTFAQGFLRSLTSADPFSDFTSGFFRRTLLSFLQTHANPANCRHRPPGFSLS